MTGHHVDIHTQLFHMGAPIACWIYLCIYCVGTKPVNQVEALCYTSEKQMDFNESITVYNVRHLEVTLGSTSEHLGHYLNSL